METLTPKDHEKAWRGYFADGRFEFDNGEDERQLRRVTLGRKNSLFAGSDKGAVRLGFVPPCRREGGGSVMGGSFSQADAGSLRIGG